VVVVAELEEQVELLAERGVVVGEVDAEDVEGFGEGAAAGDDLGAAVAEQVEGGVVLVDPDRVQHREDGHAAGKPNPAGAGGGGGQHDGWGRDGEVEGVVLAEGEDVQAAPVGEGGVPDDLVDALLIRRRASGRRVGLDVAERDDAKVHEGPLLLVGCCAEARAGPWWRCLLGRPRPRSGQAMVMTSLPRVPAAKAAKAAGTWSRG
jgi:hypothetical protein